MAQGKLIYRVGSGLSLHGVAMTFLVLPVSGQVAAAESIAPETVRSYATREERRETGVKHHLADWLTAAGLIEFESVAQRHRLTEISSAEAGQDLATALQLSLVIAPWSWSKAELIYEYDGASDEHRLDEAILATETGDLDVELGKLYVPFGEYFSHFVTGPLLEFGETRATGMVLSYGVDHRLDVTGFVYQVRAQRPESGSGGWGGGFSVEGSPTSSLTLGSSYLSDLADIDIDLSSDGQDQDPERVSGLSAYARAGFDRFDITAEWVQALKSFRAADPDRNQPRAWNIEIAYDMERNFEWALRLEGSSELENAPRLQGGAALAWRIAKHASITLEYLQGSYQSGLAEDAQGRELDRVHQTSAQVSIEF